MVTRVLDSQGNVLHDCAEEDCYVSWDGQVIDAARYNAAHPPVATDTASASDASPDAPEPALIEAKQLQRGDAVPGATAPSADDWNVRGHEAVRVEPDPA